MIDWLMIDQAIFFDFLYITWQFIYIEWNMKWNQGYLTFIDNSDVMPIKPFTFSSQIDATDLIVFCQSTQQGF